MCSRHNSSCIVCFAPPFVHRWVRGATSLKVSNYVEVAPECRALLHLWKSHLNVERCISMPLRCVSEWMCEAEHVICFSGTNVMSTNKVACQKWLGGWTCELPLWHAADGIYQYTLAEMNQIRHLLTGLLVLMVGSEAKGWLVARL